MTDFANDPDTIPKQGDADRAGHQPPVLVVGAGPTGLLLASELERRGVPCHLIDAQPAPMHWDRATVVHPRSLEFFESLGIVDRFLDAGCRQRIVRIHSAGKVLGTLDLSSSGSIYGFNLGLSEEVTESILTDYLHRQGGEVHRSSRLVGLAPHRDGVVADIERSGERYQVDARWVVGCDGFHSPTREFCGIRFEGHDIDKPWAVFDATLQGWSETYEAIFAYFERLPVILTAIPGRRWRVYMRPSSPGSDLVAEATATVQLYARTVSFVDVENPTRFHCHSKVATQYRSGRVLLAGDAAHLCSPAEGHGMNSGLQDAFNLAWKLALVYHGAAQPALLDSYGAERLPVAQLVAESGDDFERSLSLTDPIERDSRDQAISATIADPKSRHHDIVAETELNIDYARSPIVFGDANTCLAAGQRVPDMIPVQLSGARSCRLHELAHRAGHTLLLVGGPAAHGLALADLHAALERRIAGSPLFDAVIALGTSSDLPIQIGRLETAGADLLGVQGITLLVVRPDGYIGMRCDQDHLSAFERYSALVFAGRLRGLS